MKKWFVIILSILVFLVSGCTQQNYQQQGYVEAQFTYISPNFSGVLQQLLVTRGTMVKDGAPLFTLEEQPESSEVKQIAGQLEQAKAQKVQNQAALTLAEISLQRQQTLYPKRATSKEAVDIAQSNFDQATATLAASNANIIALQASLEKAQWSKGKKTLLAPTDALVFDTFYTPGELIEAGQPVVALLVAANIYIVFYLPESNLGGIKLGQKVQISCDGCPEIIIAEIGYISPQAEYTPPVIFSRETRDKLVYRIEAYVNEADAYKLHPGQPVTVKLL